MIPKLKLKRSLMKTTNFEFKKINENKKEIISIHEGTYRQAKNKSNLSSVGPFTRDNFPLLKVSEKNKEFFVRISKWTIKRYYINDDGDRINDDFFYPSVKGLQEIEISPHNSYFPNIYRRLQNDGLGSFSYTSKKSKLKRVEPVKTAFKRIPLKKKSKRLSLRKFK